MKNGLLEKEKLAALKLKPIGLQSAALIFIVFLLFNGVLTFKNRETGAIAIVQW